MKKLIALCLVAVLALSVLAVPGYAADAETIVGYSWKNITFKNDVDTLPDLTTWTAESTATAWKITNAAGMVKLSHIVNDGNTLEGKTVYLANDIDMKDVVTAPMLDADDATGAYDKYDASKTDVFWPIGYNYGNTSATDMSPLDSVSKTMKIFSGTFDGQGHVILNFKIDTDIVSNTRTDSGIANKCPVELGLFGSVRAATIQNLIMDNTCSIADRFRSNDDGVKADGSAVGLFVGRIIGSTATLKNLCNYGSVITSNGFAGGILGVVAPKTTIANCTNAGAITGVHVVGGLLGFNNGSNEITFTDCRNTGMITGKSNAADGSLSTQYKARNGFSGAAGFVGRTSGNLKFTNCINSGNVDGYFDVGGFTGVKANNRTFTLTNCKAYGTAKRTSNTGVVTNKVGPYTTSRPTTFVLDGTSITTLDDFNAANVVTTAPDTTVDYAKIEKILQVKGQVRESAVSGKVDLRFVSTVDSTDYAKVGFIITLTPAGSASKTREAMGTKVYTSIQGSDSVSVVDYQPASFSADSEYFVTFTVTEIDPVLYAEMDITVQAVAELTDGSRLIGKPVTCRIGDFELPQ